MTTTHKELDELLTYNVCLDQYTNPKNLISQRVTHPHNEYY